MDPNLPPTPIVPAPTANPVPAVAQKTPMGLSIITILLLLLIFPAGALVMWFATKWPKVAKFIIAGIGLIIFVILAVLTINGLTLIRNSEQIDQEVRNKPGYGFNLQPADKSLSGREKGARNFQRIGDVDAIVMHLEENYDVEQGVYPVLQGSWFATGEIPRNPGGGSYLGLPTEPTANFNICVNLEDVTPNQYCKASQHK